jgi:hypothetical protein
MATFHTRSLSSTERKASASPTRRDRKGHDALRGGRGDNCRLHPSNPTATGAESPTRSPNLSATEQVSPAQNSPRKRDLSGSFPTSSCRPFSPLLFFFRVAAQLGYVPRVAVTGSGVFCWSTSNCSLLCRTTHPPEKQRLPDFSATNERQHLERCSMRLFQGGATARQEPVA